MNKIINRVPYKEFIATIPHPVVVSCLTQRIPVIIQDVPNLAEKRENLGNIIPKLQNIQMKEYGYHTGLLKNDNLIHTHVNPLIDKVPAPTKEEEEKYPETYRLHQWPQLDGYKKAVQDTYQIVRESTLIIAKNIDQHMNQVLKEKGGLENYQSLHDLTQKSQITTGRSFYYRERTTKDDSNTPSFNFHYDRMNLSCAMQDFYFMKGQRINKPENAGLFFNIRNGEMYNLVMGESDISFHMGMTCHIFTAGVIPASCHAVYLPSIEGLARASQAFFFCPSAETDVRPPIECDFTDGIKEDAKLLNAHIGLKNWKQPGMKYKEFNEAIVQGFKKVFFKE